VLCLVTGAIGLVTSIKFGWNIMLMNTRYIIGIGIVHSIVITCRCTVFTWRCICITWHGSGYILLGKVLGTY